MSGFDPLFISFAAALGIGLLIGAERERRKGEGPQRGALGVRTFALASLAGAISFTIGGAALLALAAGGLLILGALAYWRAPAEDPGVTTETALFVTVLLGGLAMTRPALAAGVAVATAILLSARTPLHRFTRAVLTEGEIKDALTLAAATLIVLPLLPDEQMGPYGALNPRSIWIIVILVMAIGALGHVAIRAMGAPWQALHPDSFRARRPPPLWEPRRGASPVSSGLPQRAPFCRRSQPSSNWQSFLRRPILLRSVLLLRRLLGPEPRQFSTR